MEDNHLSSLEECFSDLPDPRVRGRCDHKSMDILMIAVCAAVCAAVCGADSWVGVETVARAKEDWFRQFLKLENGIPSHDTFGDVFAKKSDREAFQMGFMRWVEGVFRVTKGQVVALEGKTVTTEAQAKKRLTWGMPGQWRTGLCWDSARSRAKAMRLRRSHNCCAY